MSLLVEFRPEAETDLISARDWYEEQQPELSRSFLRAVENVLDRVKANPKMYVSVLRDVRRAKIQRFPYLITIGFYRHISK